MVLAVLVLAVVAVAWTTRLLPGTGGGGQTCQRSFVLRQSAGANAGYVFITDRSGTNPYSGLPAYWANESASVAANCTGRQ
jgi:hypothetical protein